MLAAGARVCDGVIHAAFMRPPAGYASASASASYVDSSKVDLDAITSLATALTGSGRPLVVTSGTLAVAPGRIGTEDDPADLLSLVGPRAPSEPLALSAASWGVRAIVVRLPPSVHGDDDRGFVPTLIGVERRLGASAYVGDGSNRWPAVHRTDAGEWKKPGLSVEAARSSHSNREGGGHGVGDQA